jgi:hypothetical protein
MIEIKTLVVTIHDNDLIAAMHDYTFRPQHSELKIQYTGTITR